MTAKHYLFEVKPNIPPQLAKLPLLSKDLIYSWKEPIRQLFIRLDPELWEHCSHNPSVFLRRIEQHKLDKAAVDADYLTAYRQTVEWYRHYQDSNGPPNQDTNTLLNPKKDLVVYFCSEFGLHESLPVYSGGLGILAGDHCKAANDICLPFIAVGLLYHQGYFTQTIDPDGNQIATNINHYFGHLPISLLKDDKGNELHCELSLNGSKLTLRLWEAKVGRVKLLLLDSDLACNREEDRSITRQLYGDGVDTRIKQEIVLGIGGVKALRTLGLQPNIWHINEGHAAFQIVQRCLEGVEQGTPFDAALEWVAGSTVFTTHTPVAAGHDSFSRDTMENYFAEMAEQLGIEFETLMALGYANGDDSPFNMTAFALRGSRFHNGVSKIHGGIASAMESYIWPEVPPEDNPLDFLTNGVHINSILAKRWAAVFDQHLSLWQHHLLDKDYWQCIDNIPNGIYWRAHRALKSQLLSVACKRLTIQQQRNACSLALQKSSTCQIKNTAGDILVLGFARRFATYKRATLLFSDLPRLEKILNNPERPVIILFAGKAHPSDEPGQQLIRDIHQFSERPEFIGKIILLEGYDLALARYMVAGCDIWLNTPVYPLEACGTSGQKAAINGVVNLSIMDGWWAEGFNEKNGWGIEPHSDKYGDDYRNQQEASDLLDIIENEVIPAYFERDDSDLPVEWLRLSKASMKSCIPQFSAQRMLMDYIEKFYLPAKRQNQRLGKNKHSAAIILAQWKQQIRSCWPGVKARVIEQSALGIHYGDKLSITLGVDLNGLSPKDIIVECLSGYLDATNAFRLDTSYTFNVESKPAADTEAPQEVVYRLEIEPQSSGIYHYKLRLYPFHALLSHNFEMGFMRWL
ncbi:MAG: alpha-glucan family phosphorylase [Oceanicoccus sp.]|uniref:alpha-glucan family phosphorylase n=1 Tax=Oceanicoccus sp. TaxID=2691044 RepID=UPI00260E537A|nr:alpha-glucan family phosphorylase [Oceanicoccus sp.]MDG1772472.1 alpha-glucan family phosphorylase [Oceanicoccus sp.]